ncbi:dTDP-4-dehydrorhamnose reductase [Candidatus Peregrinibacteria bacterium]|nr:dTDP-4-dehydrorhamnose reductase [Candidatus Peregrinibacteria bacterium]
MKTSLLLFGSNGMLGKEFFEAYKKDFEIIPVSLDDLDLRETEKILPKILKISPNAILNSAAWTDVEKAENPEVREDVFRLNRDAPREMAKACGKLNIPFFHVSTDFVFAGGKEITNYKLRITNFSENSEKNPLNIYGQSKSEGENAAMREWEKTYIVRTAWLYGKFGRNFVEKIIQRSGQQSAVSSQIPVVNDQFGNPTWTKYVAKTLEMLIRDNGEKYTPGIYHAVSEVGETPPSWYDFAVKIFEYSNMDVHVKAISSAEFPSKVKRPVSSVLKNTKLSKLPTWEEMISEYLSQKKNS